jgi:hypothetical protein
MWSSVVRRELLTLNIGFYNFVQWYIFGKYATCARCILYNLKLHCGCIWLSDWWWLPITTRKRNIKMTKIDTVHIVGYKFCTSHYLYKTWYSQGVDYENHCLLGHDTVYFGRQVPIFLSDTLQGPHIRCTKHILLQCCQQIT